MYEPLHVRIHETVPRGHRNGSIGRGLGCTSYRIPADDEPSKPAPIRVLVENGKPVPLNQQMREVLPKYSGRAFNGAR